MANKNIAKLHSFVTYCDQHKDQRFWQALRNWSGASFIYTGDKPQYAIDHIDPEDFVMDLHDTFYDD